VSYFYMKDVSASWTCSPFSILCFWLWRFLSSIDIFIITDRSRFLLLSELFVKLFYGSEQHILSLPNVTAGVQRMSFLNISHKNTTLT